MVRLAGDPLEEPIMVLMDHGLDLRTVNLLEGAGFLYVGQLRGVTREQVLEIPNVGSASLGRLVKSLREFLEEK